MIIEALLNISPGASWDLNGDDISGLVWKDENIKRPSDEAILAEVERLKFIHIANEYQRLRKPEYPSIGDQLDALFHAGVFPEDMAAKIQAVKNKYPKS